MFNWIKTKTDNAKVNLATKELVNLIKARGPNFTAKLLATSSLVISDISDRWGQSKLILCFAFYAFQRRSIGTRCQHQSKTEPLILFNCWFLINF